MAGERVEFGSIGCHRRHVAMVCVLGVFAAVVAGEAYCEYPAAADDGVAGRLGG